MSKTLALALATLTLASTMLAGCGTTGMTGLSTLNSQTAAVQAKDYYSVTNAQSIASNALYQYNDLRNQWLAANDDSQKDQIEDQMLAVLSQGLGNVRSAVSAESGANGYDSREVFNIADEAISQYNSLREEWAQTTDVNQQREIANQMETLMVNALQQVQSVQTTNDSVSNPTATNQQLEAPATTETTSTDASTTTTPNTVSGSRPMPPLAVTKTSK